MPDLRSRGPGGLNLLTAAEASAKLQRGEATSQKLVEDCLDRIEARDHDVRSWAFIDPALALAQARARDKESRRSELHGVPVGIKDIFDTYDMPTAYGLKAHKNHRPTFDTALVSILRTAGAVIMGKCVTTEFASPVPVGTRNPHDLTRSPGVSSSGSAAAVADFMVPLALGSQTGGSTILPAAFCGVVGYKASLMGLDRGGIRHLRPSLDTMGLFARSIEDIALLRSVLTGVTPIQAQGISRPRIGVCRSIKWADAQPETVKALEQAIDALKRAGADMVDAEMPPVFNGIEESFRIISSLEGARAIALEVRDHLDSMNHWIKAADASTKSITLEQYDVAQLHAIECRQALQGLFQRCDVILTPSTCGESVADLASVSNSAFNRIWTLMHTPCATIPAFSGPNGMPVGVQIVGPVGADDRMLGLTQWIADRIGR